MKLNLNPLEKSYIFSEWPISRLAEYIKSKDCTSDELLEITKLFPVILAERVDEFCFINIAVNKIFPNATNDGDKKICCTMLIKAAKIAFDLLPYRELIIKQVPTIQAPFDQMIQFHMNYEDKEDEQLCKEYLEQFLNK